MRYRWRLICLGFFLLPLLGAGLTLLSLDRKEQRIRFDDGSAFLFLDATSGTAHEYAWGVGANWAGMFPWLPAPLTRRLPSNLPIQHKTDSDSLCVWVSSGDGIPDNARNAALFDEKGFGIPGRLVLVRPPIGIYEFSSFPSDSKTLSMRLYQRDEDRGITVPASGEFVFSNPCFEKRSALSGPASAMVGDQVKVSVKSLTALPCQKVDRAFSYTGAQATIHVEDSPQAWFPLMVQASDRWGHLYAALCSKTSVPGESISRLTRAPMPTEPWKLRITLCRRAGFKDSELVLFENLPLPMRGETTHTNISRRIGATTVEVQSIRRLDSNRAELSIQVRPARADVYLSIVEVNGKQVPPNVSFAETAIRSRLNIPADSTGVSVKLSVHSSEAAEIVQQPTIVEGRKDVQEPLLRVAIPLRPAGGRIHRRVVVTDFAQGTVAPAKSRADSLLELLDRFLGLGRHIHFLGAQMAADILHD